MFSAYLKIAIRNLARHKAFFVINLMGLSVGIGACLLILNYVIGERNVDKFHRKADSIYRIQDEHYNNNSLASSSVSTYPAVGPALKSDYPAVKEFVRMYPVDEAVMSYNDILFKEEKIYFADPSFFILFSFPLIQSASEHLLSVPNTIVLTASVAKRYFGDSSPIGKLVTMRIGVVSLSLTVTGVMADPPQDSHLQFSSLVSYKTMRDLAGPDIPETSWSWAQVATYIQLTAGADPMLLEKKLADFMNRHNGNALTASHENDVLSLQPLKDIYLHASVGGEFDRRGSGLAVYTLSLIAAFILAIAWINYINLSTAKGLYRAKEVGVKKVIGASRAQLIQQFLLESALLNLLAILLGLCMYIFLLPFFNDVMGRTVNLTTNLWLTGYLWTALATILVVGTFLSGLYPAFVLSSFNPARAFKSKPANTGNFSFRKALVVFQFAVSAGLIAATFIVFRQINFMRNKDLGANLSNTIIVNPPVIKDVDSIRQLKVSVLRNELGKIPFVREVSFAASVPGEPLSPFSGVIRKVGAPLSDAQPFEINMVDEHYFELLGNAFVAGRNFSTAFGADKNSVVINESAATLLGFRKPAEAIGEKIYFPSGGIIPVRIVGVIRNYHHVSLKNAIEPSIFGWRNTLSYCLLKINSKSIESAGNVPGRIRDLLAKVDQVWSKELPGNPFSYFFLDEFFNRQYKNDEEFGNLFGIFTGVAIVIACLGLLGLASFVTQQRTKEISIRKVLGAGMPGILLLLSADFVKLVLLASLIALPVSGYLMGHWLADYAFRIPLSWWLFAVPALLILVVALLTVSYQTFKTAAVNPAKSLRAE